MHGLRCCGSDHMCEEAQGIRPATIPERSLLDFPRQSLSMLRQGADGTHQGFARKRKLQIARQILPHGNKHVERSISAVVLTASGHSAPRRMPERYAIPSLSVAYQLIAQQLPDIALHSFLQGCRCLAVS